VAPPVANVVTAARAPPVRARLPVAVGLKHPTRFGSEHIREEVESKEEDQHVESDLEDVQNYEEEGIVIKEQEEESKHPAASKTRPTTFIAMTRQRSAATPWSLWSLLCTLREGPRAVFYILNMYFGICILEYILLLYSLYFSLQVE
jgi:hypothetical protein